MNEITPIIPIRNNQEAAPLIDGADILVNASNLPTKEEKQAEMAFEAARNEAYAALGRVGQKPEAPVNISLEYRDRIQSATLLVNDMREERLAA